jgi:hypothetical protein
MALIIIGLLLAFLFGFYAGHAPMSKWPKMELFASCSLAFLLVVLVLLWKQHTQGACQRPGYYTPYGSPGVCVNMFTFKNICLGYAGFLTGLGVGLLYRLTTAVLAKRRLSHRGKS